MAGNKKATQIHKRICTKECWTIFRPKIEWKRWRRRWRQPHQRRQKMSSVLLFFRVVCKRLKLYIVAKLCICRILNLPFLCTPGGGWGRKMWIFSIFSSFYLIFVYTTAETSMHLDIQPPSPHASNRLTQKQIEKESESCEYSWQKFYNRKFTIFCYF